MLPRLPGEVWHVIRERLAPCAHAPGVALHHEALRTARSPRAVEGGSEDAGCVGSGQNRHIWFLAFSSSLMFAGNRVTFVPSNECAPAS
uniref:Uncharacterized protein n=1 Tax=uncultured marine virus TaxID=186617 RepID=A0A0F7LAD3_9VIRU|nr:hypothetical protein [uncultured marine virus]